MKKYSFESFLDTLENIIFFQMPKSTTYNDATWMETLNHVSIRPSLSTTFYGFHFGALSYEKIEIFLPLFLSFSDNLSDFMIKYLFFITKILRK